METLELSQLALAYFQAALPRILAPNQEAWDTKVREIRERASEIAQRKGRAYVFANDVVAAYRELGYGVLRVSMEASYGRKGKRDKRT